MFSNQLNVRSVKAGFTGALLFLSLALTACGGSEPTPPPPPPEPTKVPAADIEAGKALFTKNGCVACHTIEGVSNGTVGPNLSKIYVDAGKIVTQADYKSSKGKAKSAEEYIRESILDPNAYVYPDCPTGKCAAGVMVQNFKDQISEADLNVLVGFLMAQGR